MDSSSLRDLVSLISFSSFHEAATSCGYSVFDSRQILCILNPQNLCKTCAKPVRKPAGKPVRKPGLNLNLLISLE